jgi:predicted GNAT family acetyltransferase
MEYSYDGKRVYNIKAMVDDIVVAQLYALKYPNLIYISMVKVDEKHRGKGICSEMIRLLIENTMCQYYALSNVGGTPSCKCYKRAFGIDYDMYVSKDDMFPIHTFLELTIPLMPVILRWLLKIDKDYDCYNDKSDFVFVAR